MKKYSKQRELILNSLQSRTDHPTAEMLYTDLKKEMPEIGIATVYRNLVSLHEDNKIIKINIESDRYRFDGNINKHVHIVCDKCKEVQDLFLSEESMNIIEEMIQNTYIDSGDSRVTICGICKKCKEGLA